MVEENKQFISPEGDYKQYNQWLSGVNSTGKQPQFDATSDMRVKKFVVDTIGNDDILRKQLMLGFVTNGIIDKSLADLYILKRLVKE